MEILKAFLTIRECFGYGRGSSGGSGDDYGAGDGSGYGYGSGSGYDYGAGYGYGDSSGSGYGYGNSSDNGYGYGYGCVSGCGNIYGDGSSYGDGYGIKSINSEPVHLIDGTPTIIKQIHGNIAKGAILQEDLTLTPCYIVKNGDMFAHGETLRKAQEALRDKLFEDMSEEERIDAFLSEIKPKTEYPVMIFFDWHHRLTGSCEMGRTAFAKDHGFDLDKDTITLEGFLELTKNAYGGSVIREVIAEIKRRNAGV